MERSSKDDRREEEEIKSKILTRGKHSKSFCCPTNALVQPKTRVEKRTRKKMALCGSGRSADSARRCIGFGALVVVLLCCFSSFDATSIDECFQGPNFWCLNRSTEVLCNFTNQTVGLCGFTNKRCQIKTGGEFCQSAPPAQQQSPFAYNGGITGAEENLFSYYILSLYWPPSSCASIYNETGDLLKYFCSPFTDAGQPGSERLALHGLWPTFFTDGNYQGWPQYCSSPTHDWSLCHIDGNLCPWKNTSRHDFSQGNYEYCLARENLDQCLVNANDVLQPEYERLKIFAPGYLNHYNLFINHEWTKHGSCCSSIFANNISSYLTTMLDLIEWQTGADSLTYQYIQLNAGGRIPMNFLLEMFNQTATVSCNSKCQLEELALCFGRDESTGYPTHPIPCPLGARNTSDSCAKSHCELLSIPKRSTTPKHRIESTSPSDHCCFCFLLMLILLLIVVKLFVRLDAKKYFLYK